MKLERLFCLAFVAFFAFCTGACAKKTVKLNDGPFKKGTVLEELSRLELRTAEIAAFMPEAKKLFVVGDANVMEVVDFSNPKKMVRLDSVLLDGNATSVSAFGNLLAVSILGNPDWEKGFVEVLEVSDSIRKVGTYGVCYHPDMVTFTPDGKKVLVACEGEPDSENKMNDPDGGVAILEMENASTGNIPVVVLPFNNVDVEPEYITVSQDSRTAWVSLQENNAIARVDVENMKIDTIFDLGFVDHSKEGFGIDAINDGKIRIENAFIRSIRQPDGIKAFELNGRTFVATANEGEEDSKITPKSICGDAEKCKMMYGSRSVSLFDGFTGKLVWDSGDQLERAFAEVAPKYFNWNAKKGKVKIDARSDRKGSEPENVVVGKLGDKLLGFVTLERMSGIATFDFSNADTNPPKLIGYYMDPRDRGPEGILFIDGEHSPLKGIPLLVVGYEYSKSLVVYVVK